MILRKIVIVVKARTEEDVAETVEEVARQIQEGYVMGHNTSENSSYHYTSTADVPDGEIPL